MKTKTAWLMLALLGLSQGFAHAWGPTGHMLVAEIAYDKLTQDGALNTRSKVAKLATKLKHGKVAYNFVTVACWMDDTRNKETAGWHFIDVPFTVGGASFNPPAGQNALWKVGVVLNHLETKGPDYKGIEKDVAYLMHLVGDLHQPLHCAERDNDAGGNLCKLEGVPDKDNLHSFWDAAFRYAEVDGKPVIAYPEIKPPSAPGKGEIETRAEEIVRDYLPGTGTGQLSPKAWVKESYKIACTDAYTDLQQDSNTMKYRFGVGYTSRAHDDACKRIALAGYRLANLLEKIFGTS